ncbi:MAG: hypothetical protein ACUVT7_04590 [Thermoplasmata archaeon]
MGSETVIDSSVVRTSDGSYALGWDWTFEILGWNGTGLVTTTMMATKTAMNPTDAIGMTPPPRKPKRPALFRSYS